MITRFKNFLASSLPNLRGKRQHRRLAHSFVFVDPTTPIDRRVYISGSSSSPIYVGNYCSIAPYACILTNNHSRQLLCMQGQFYAKNGVDILDLISSSDITRTKGPINISHDVWIGYSSFVGSNVSIGIGSVIGALSTITKDIPPYSIVVGNNKFIGRRFDDATIDLLLKSQWWMRDFQFLTPRSRRELFASSPEIWGSEEWGLIHKCPILNE